MKQTASIQNRRIVWARNIRLDVDLHKTTEIGILRQMAERGYQIVFISAHSKQRYKFRTTGIRVFSIPVGRNFSFVSRLIFSFVQLLSFPICLVRLKPSFVVVDPDSIFGLIPTLPFFQILGAKIVLDIRSTPTPVEDLSRKVGLIKQLRTFSFRCSVAIAKKKLNGLTIITDLMKKDICSEFRIDPTWVGVWSSGVSEQLFTYEKHASNAMSLRQRLGLAEKFLICYHGGFAQSRGITDAIDAMLEIREHYPSAVLFLLGGGSVETMDNIERSIRDKGLHNSVVLHEPVKYEQVPDYLAMCDVGIVPLPDLPQWRHQCPLKLLEYLAMKKVVILTDIPCHKDIIGASKCGIFMYSTHPDEIARSIAFAFHNKNKLKNWGIAGRAIIERKYTWKTVADNLEDYLLHIAGEGGEPSVNSREIKPQPMN